MHCCRYGNDQVIATDVKFEPASLIGTGPYEFLDVTDEDAVRAIVVNHRADLIIHLASLLSAVGEQNPLHAMKVNARGTEAVLNVAAQMKCRVFTPSTIAVFGPTTPRDNTPNDTVLRPTTIYGVTKVYGELLGKVPGFGSLASVLSRRTSITGTYRGILRPQIWRRLPCDPLPRHHLQQGSPRRRHDGLRRRYLLRCLNQGLLHVVLVGRYCPAHDVYAW
jgi:dTDP-4-dehydrorhamnose reductase